MIHDVEGFGESDQMAESIGKKAGDQKLSQSNIPKYQKTAKLMKGLHAISDCEFKPACFGLQCGGNFQTLLT